MKLSIITLLLILLLCGCSTHPQNENGKFIRIDIENSANNPFNLSNLSKEVSYIKLETNDSCLINSIKAIFYIDNQIIIRDNNSILFFDNTGKFQYKVNHQGDGPEEYLRLSDFDICSKNETMHILDTRKKQILQYDMKGKFQNKKILIFGPLGCSFLMIPRVFYIVGIKYHKTKVINLQSIITLSRVYQVDFTLFLRKSPIIYMFIITLILVNMEMNSYSTNCIMTRFTL